MPNELEDGCCRHHPYDPDASARCVDHGLCAPRSATQPGRRPSRRPDSRETVLPREFVFPTIARAIEDAYGRWLDHEDLRSALAAAPELADRAAAAAQGDQHTWKSPDLFLGNGVAQWSKAWTDGTDEYAARFERSGSIQRNYRYRISTV